MSTSIRSLLAAASLFALCLIPAMSTAQLSPTADGFRLVSSSVEIGIMEVTGASPPSGYAANSEYWDWDTGWPSADFNVIHDSSATASSSADYTDDADFPSAANTKLPRSIGAGDKMYAISVCTGSPPDCTGAGYLWVEDGGATLHWYLRSSWSTDRILDDVETEIAHFDYLTSPPNNNSNFRYLELDRQ